MPAFSTPLTLATARSLVRNLILERAADVGLVTDAELTDIVNLAARTIFLRIATKYPEAFAQRSAVSIAVPANVIPFSSIVSGGGGAGNVFRILNVSVGPTGAADNVMEQIFELDKVAGRQVYEPAATASVTSLVAQPTTPYRWYVEGQNLYFTPHTVGSFDAKIMWVQQPQDMTADGDTVWQGQMAMYHDTVVALAATFAETKDGLASPAAMTVFGILDQALVDNYGAAGQPRNPYAEASKNSRP